MVWDSIRASHINARYNVSGRPAVLGNKHWAEVELLADPHNELLLVDLWWAMEELQCLSRRRSFHLDDCRRYMDSFAQPLQPI